MIAPMSTVPAVAEAPGANVTEKEQLAPVAKVPEQPLVNVKFDPLVPPTVTLPMVSGAVPLLVSVTVCAGLLAPGAVPAKVRPVVDSVAPGVSEVPAKATVWVAVAALVTTLTVAE